MSRSELAASLDALWHYLGSWRCGDKLLGQAVSYWEWAPAVVAPHSMHAWPVAFGLLDLHARGSGQRALDEARNLCSWYLEDRAHDSAALAWAGGETPRKRTGDVLQSAPILALAWLAQHDRDGPWLQRAVELRDVVLDRFWDGRTVSYVGNHGAYMLAAEALLEQAGAPGGSRDRMRSLLACIERTVYRKGWCEGAVAQADFDPRVFDIYVGKALFGLSLFADRMGVAPVAALLTRIGDYLVRRIELVDPFGQDGFRNWRPRMVRSRLWGAIRRVHRDLACEALRRRVESLSTWDGFGPAWVARGALVSLGLRHAARVLDRADYHDAADRVDRWLMLHQDATGGVRNSFGFLGDPDGGDLWPDVVRPVRWNAYVFAAWAGNPAATGWVVPGVRAVPDAYEVACPVRSAEGGFGSVVETADHLDFVDVFEAPLRVAKRVVREDYRDCGGNAQRPEYARDWVPGPTRQLAEVAR